MSVAISPLTPDLWPHFEDLFGKQGACYGCWCTLFQAAAGSAAREQSRAQQGSHQGAHRGRPAAGPAGLRGRARPSAGCRSARAPTCPNSTMRAGAPRRWNRAMRPIPRVWAISCFFIRSQARGKGLTHKLVERGHRFRPPVGCARARSLPDGPVEGFALGRPLSSARPACSRRPGFSRAAERKPGRPLMRLELYSAARPFGRAKDAVTL